MRIKSNKPCVKDTLFLNCGDITIKFDKYEAGYKITFCCSKNDEMNDHVAEYEFLDKRYANELDEIFSTVPLLSFLSMSGTIEFEIGLLKQNSYSIYFSMNEMQYEFNESLPLLTRYEILVSSSYKNFDKFNALFEVLKKDNFRKMEAMKNVRQSNRIKY